MVVAATLPAMAAEREAVEAKALEIVELLSKTKFNAKRVFLAVLALDKCFQVQG